MHDAGVFSMEVVVNNYCDSVYESNMVQKGEIS